MRPTTKNSKGQTVLNNPIALLWVAGGVMSVYFLAKMMRGKQALLNSKLHAYLEDQVEWVNKKMKSRRLARRAALEQARKEAELEKFASALADGEVDFDSDEGMTSESPESPETPVAADTSN